MSRRPGSRPSARGTMRTGRFSLRASRRRTGPREGRPREDQRFEEPRELVLLPIGVWNELVEHLRRNKS